MTILRLIEAPRAKVAEKLLAAHKSRSLKMIAEYQPPPAQAAESSGGRGAAGGRAKVVAGTAWGARTRPQGSAGAAAAGEAAGVAPAEAFGSISAGE